jgi:hypothetical protein
VINETAARLALKSGGPDSTKEVERMSIVPFPPAHAPALVITFALEAAPRVTTDCLSEGEYRRLLDWIRAHEDLHALTVLALELEETAA